MWSRETRLPALARAVFTLVPTAPASQGTTAPLLWTLLSGSVAAHELSIDRSPGRT